MMKIFPLARMDTVLYRMTAAFIAVPILLVVVALALGLTVLLVVAGFIGAILLLVWCWFRPTCFELRPGSVRIVWPARSAEFSLDNIDRVERYTKDRFLAEFGRGMRIGAGGVWGGFGLLRTKKGETLRFYISRIDEYVILRMKAGYDLMITPEQPDEFVRMLGECIVKDLKHRR